MKVFQQNSRGENFILDITEKDTPDLKDVANQLLGKEVFVSWPHLIEAKVGCCTGGGVLCCCFYVGSLLLMVVVVIDFAGGGGVLCCSFYLAALFSMFMVVMDFVRFFSFYMVVS